MKKAYSLKEVIVVIVILGLASITLTNSLRQIYLNLFITKEISTLQNTSVKVLNQIENYMKRGVKESFVRYNGDRTIALQRIDSNNYTPIRNLTNGDLINGDILLWIDKDIENLTYGDWNVDYIKPYYNKWFNIETSNNRNFISIDSQFTKLIDNQKEMFNTNLVPSVHFIYANKIGTPFNRFWNLNPQSLFPIEMDTTHGTEPLTDNAMFLTRQPLEIGELYDISYTAYGIRYDAPTKELRLIYNFQPWETNGGVQETFDDGSEKIILKNVSQFNFWIENNLLRLEICVQSEQLIVDEVDDTSTELCKERTLEVL